MTPEYYVKPGDVLEHYKGGQYAVLAVCYNEANRKEMIVSYISLEDGRAWTRELSQFNEMTVPEDTEKYGSDPVLRFKVIGEVQVLVNAGEPYGDFAVVSLQPKENVEKPLD